MQYTEYFILEANAYPDNEATVSLLLLQVYFKDEIPSLCNLKKTISRTLYNLSSNKNLY